MSIRTGLIEAGVKNLREYGYPTCDAESILTDPVYKAFFQSMLRDNKGHGKDIDAAIDGLLAETQP
jgi:hypothetical protein